jgi:hypothetical protein
MNPKRSKSRNAGKMPMVHPNAAAIDVGATMHMAAVRAACTASSADIDGPAVAFVTSYFSVIPAGVLKYPVVLVPASNPKRATTSSLADPVVIGVVVAILLRLKLPAATSIGFTGSTPLYCVMPPSARVCVSRVHVKLLGSEAPANFQGAVRKLVGIEVGVVSGVFNLESPGVDAPGWRLRHEEAYHTA